MRTIKEMMDSLTDRDKYLWSLIEKLPMLPREGMDQAQQHFWAVQIAVYDITAIDATDDFIRKIEIGTFKSLDDLQYYLTYDVLYEDVDEYIASNKNKKYTPMFEQIANKFGLNLNDNWNIIYNTMSDYHGRRANKYHQFVLSQMRIFADEAIDQKDFLRMFDEFKEILNSDDYIGMMYSAFWKKYK